MIFTAPPPSGPTLAIPAPGLNPGPSPVDSPTPTSSPSPAPRTPRGVRVLLTVLVAILGLGLISGCAASAAAAPLVPTPEHAPSAQRPMTQTDVDAWLDGMLPATLERAGIAGATVAIVHDGKTLSTRGFGQSRTGTDGRPAQPVDPDRDLFRVGSISKTFTATAVMQLVEQGKIDLDADVTTYLDFKVPEPRGPITMRNLLTHTAGFEERPQGTIVPLGSQPMDLRAFLATDPPDQIFAPGTTPSYSNYGNTLAGYIVQRVSGQPYEEYVQRHVLDRIGMASSSFSQPLPPALAARMSEGYADVAQPATPFEQILPAPAGALSATATDMGHYMLAQLGEVGRDQALLQPATLELMHAPALTADTLGRFADGPRMSLGFFDDSRNGHRVLGHLGDTTVFHSSLDLYPDDRSGIFLSLNSSGTTPADVQDIRESVAQGFADRYFPGSAPNATVQPTATEHAAMAAGTYESGRNSYSSYFSVLRLIGQTHVTARPDGTLVLTPGPLAQTPKAFEEIRPWVWREIGGQQVMTMRVSGDQVQAISYDNAFTDLRVGPAHQTAVAGTIVLASLAILLLSLVLLPVGALVRRHYGATRRKSDGILGRLRWIGVIAALVGPLAWVVVLALGLSDTTPPTLALRAIQAVQVVGLLGIIPAVGVLIRRRRSGWAPVLGGILVVLALVGIGWFSLAFHLIAPQVG